MPRKIIAVVGATGAQGGGLARAILDDERGEFALRVVTRRPTGAAACALAARGADVVAADSDVPVSLDAAFAGAYGAFCVTNFWEHLSPEREHMQAVAMAEAASRAALQHVIWSTLEDTRNWMALDDDRMPTLMGRYKVPHFDGKGEADAVFARFGVPITCLRTSFYWDNFINFPGMGVRQHADGLQLPLPLGDARMPGIAAEDIGRCALGVFRERQWCIGATIGVAGQHLNGHEMANGLSRVLGQRVEYLDITPEEYRALDIPSAAELGNMFQFKRDFETPFRAARSVEQSRALNPSLQSFDEWLALHAACMQKR